MVKIEEVLVIFGSKSDEECYNKIISVFNKEKISYVLKIASAHKTPDDIDEILKQDYKVIIAGAGLAAALPGVIAAKTLRPIIGVPCKGNYEGLDALLSIIQMPPGIPVMSVGVNQGEIAANEAINILKQPQKIVLVGDKTSKAFKKAKDILSSFDIEHSHSDQSVDNAINIDFVYFDEPIEKKDQLVIYCPLLLDNDDKAEASLNLLKHSDHGIWVGLNNGVNAALAAIEILILNTQEEQRLLDFREKNAEKVRKANEPDKK